MDVISYRGPGASGGVSSGLESNMRQHGRASFWWFLKDGALHLKRPQSREAQYVTQIPDGVIEAHYRFCNEFLWPVMHDLPQFATYNPDDHAQYRRFNQIVSDYIAFARVQSPRHFVQDYQFALLPRLLRREGLRSVTFWHIPWPKTVRDEHLGAIEEIARGLLGSDQFGFHTDEYRENFARFVRRHLPEFVVNDSSVIARRTQAVHGAQSIAGSSESWHRTGTFDRAEAAGKSAISSPVATPYMTRPLFDRRNADGETRVTRLIVHPLGIDLDAWREMSQCAPRLAGSLERFNDRPYILSVERADYTKGVIERMRSVERFFECNDDMIEKITFLQICGRTRPGLEAFDRYWSDCQAVYKRVNERFGSQYWQPIEWHTEHTSAAELALVYRKAQAMLVNPIRDGLNLTAKEFVACQPDDAGVLLLSPGAGAWHELGEAALRADPADSEALVRAVSEAVRMPLPERRARVSLLTQRISANPLESWWKRFAQAPAAAVGRPAELEGRRAKIA